MRIGIDARFYNESGVGRYIRNLLVHLQKIDSKNEYFIFLLEPDYATLKFHKNFHKALANFAWYGFAEQFKFPQLLNKYKLDLAHFPHFNVPIFYTGKFVVTIHDLIHQHHSMQRVTTLNPFTFKIKQIGYRKVFKNAITKSCKIVAPSNSVRKLLEEEWNVNSGKVVVTPEAVDNKLITAAETLTKIKSKEILNKFGVKAPYIFYIGNAHPHKNIEGLIKAFLKLRDRHTSLYLVLSGADHYFWQRVKDEFNFKDILYTGFVTDEELVALYKNAACFVMPSFEEGFGIPVLEAFSCGCPVISSNAGSLEEVGGNAALYFNPASPDDIVDKISQVLSSKALRKDLISKGQSRVKDFSWEKLTKQTLEVYEKCV